MLTFDASTHTYRWHGEVVPSVTQILKPVSPDFRMVPSETLERARQLGVAVDQTITLFELEDLDEESLDPRLAQYLDAWKRLKAAAKIDVRGVQERVFHGAMRYAGTLDIRANVAGVHSILDVKRTFAVPASAGPQTEAYRIAHNASSSPVVARFAVHMKPRDDGTVDARLHQLNNPTDGNVFLSCINIWRFRNEHGIR